MPPYKIDIDGLLDFFIESFPPGDCCVFSISGSGGKTTFIRQSAMVLADRMPVGVGASTKMRLPDKNWQIHGRLPDVLTPDRLSEENNLPAFDKCLSAKRPPVLFYADHILPDGKIWEISGQMLEAAMAQNRVLFVEADGSDCKPLKGWREDEPVILPETDVTVGILPLHCLGQSIDESLVHRMDAFYAITGLQNGDRMTVDAFIRLILHPHGLFGHARGRKLLVLNRVNSDRLNRAAIEIAKACDGIADRVVMGCLI